MTYFLRALDKMPELPRGSQEMTPDPHKALEEPPYAKAERLAQLAEA